jgi:hypothetical protein
LVPSRTVIEHGKCVRRRVFDGEVVRVDAVEPDLRDGRERNVLGLSDASRCRHLEWKEVTRG